MKKKPKQNTEGRYRLTDILWWTRQEDVFNEIAKILQLPSADTNTPGWFQLRTKASKNILNNMSQEEHEALEAEAARLQKEGLPQDVQRQYVSCISCSSQQVAEALVSMAEAIYQSYIVAELWPCSFPIYLPLMHIILVLPKQNGIPDCPLAPNVTTVRWA